MGTRAQWAKHLGLETKAPNHKRRRSGAALRDLAKAQQPKATRKDTYARYVNDVAALEAHDAAIPDKQVVQIDPVPYPRMSQRDIWEKRPSVLRYRAYADELRLRQVRLPHAYAVEFVIKMPDSWPEDLKDEMDGKPHLLVPDTSNCIKALEDALVPKDETLHTLATRKVWGRAGRITIYKADLVWPAGCS